MNLVLECFHHDFLSGILFFQNAVKKKLNKQKSRKVKNPFDKSELIKSAFKNIYIGISNIFYESLFSDLLDFFEGFSFMTKQHFSKGKFKCKICAHVFFLMI